MAASKTKKSVSKNKKEKMTTPVKSVHVISYLCSNCDEEIEELKLCSGCKAPMRVVQVIEKFGEDAEEYLQKLNADSKPKSPKKKNVKSVELDDGLGDFDSEDKELEMFSSMDGGIFPDVEKEDDFANKTDGFSRALDELLDEEEDTEDLDELGVMGTKPNEMPEL